MLAGPVVALVDRLKGGVVRADAVLQQRLDLGARGAGVCRACTVSQPLVSKPGSEIWSPAAVTPAPVVHCVVAAVLCTCQPPRPIVDVPD